MKSSSMGTGKEWRVLGSRSIVCATKV